MRVETFSRRAKRLLLEALLKAQERGADSIHLDDLVAGLIAEDQDPHSLELNEQHPAVKSAREMEPKPLGVLFPRECWIPRHPFFAPEVAAELLAKLKEILPRSSLRTDGMHTSPQFDRTFEVAEQLRNEFHQKEVQPLHVLAAAMREPCEAAKLLQEAGITEEKGS
jgi:Clp amino terminal domain, pathogenicity island component